MSRRLSDQLAPDDRGGGPIESDRAERRIIAKQMLDPVVRGLADRLVEAAGPCRRSDDVPQADMAVGEARQPRLIIQRTKLFAEHAAQQPPELIGRMRIILPGRKRRVAGQAAQNKQPGVRARDGRQTGFDAQR